MNVGLVVQNAVRRDGQGRVMVELTEALLERGHEITVYAHQLDDNLAQRVTFHEIRRARGPQVVDDVLMFLRATRAIRRGGHDAACVLGHCALPEVPWLFNVQFSHQGWRRSWTPASRPSWKHRLSTRVAERLERRCFQRATRVLASTERLASELGSRDGVRVVPNGLDLDEFSPVTPAERADARVELGIEPDRFVIAFLGDYQTPRKGLEPLLGAVASGPPDEMLVVAARGDDGALVARARSLGIADRVTAIGFAPPKLVYAAADVVAVPSLYEPFSLVTLEAAARCVPVVVSARAGAAPLLDGGGHIVDRPEEPGALRAAIDGVRADREDAAARVRVARAAVEGLTWRVVAGHAATVIEELAHEVGARQRATLP